MTNTVLNDISELNIDELAAVSGGGIIGDAIKVIDAMADAVNKALQNAAAQQIAQSLSPAAANTITIPHLPGL